MRHVSEADAQSTRVIPHNDDGREMHGQRKVLQEEWGISCEQYDPPQITIMPLQKYSDRTLTPAEFQIHWKEQPQRYLAGRGKKA